MHKKFHISIIIGLFVYSFIGLFLLQAHAQQSAGLNLTTFPSSFDIVVKPGDTSNQKFRIRNNNDTPLILTLSVKKLIPDLSGGINLVDFAKNDDEGQWISFQTATITAQPKEWTDIPFSIHPSKDAAYGYYYALFLAPQEEKQDITKPQAKVNGSLAIPILLTVLKNGATTNGNLVSFTTSQNFFEFLPVSFLTTFHNSGTVHTKPRGNIFIKDFSGKTIDTLPINEGLGSVLPNASRRFETVWNNSFITYDTKLNFHFDKVLSLRIGKYSAVALVVVSGETKDTSYTATTTFWVFPWKIILGIVLIVLLAGVGLFGIAKSFFTTLAKIFKSPK